MFDWVNKIHVGDCLQLLKQIPDNTVDCCVTSPPYYGLRNYNGGELEIGVENTPEQYIKNLVAIFAEVKRVLVADGTLWVNIGDSYNGVQSNALKPKDLIGIPWMLAFALRSPHEEHLIESVIDRGCFSAGKKPHAGGGSRQHGAGEWICRFLNMIMDDCSPVKEKILDKIQYW